MRIRLRRIEIKRLAQYSDCLVVLPPLRENEAFDRIHLGSKWRQLLTEPGLLQRFIQPPQAGQQNSVEVSRGNRTWTKFDRAAEFPVRARPVQLVLCENPCQCQVRTSQRVLDFQRLGCRLFCLQDSPRSGG